ncbi:hypothetical protein BOX15_Mlig030816g2 [Macrostomum lignano]|uniref:Uncharacterized protein n=1 Tax=Macrostomum lignano TaxID=282301 RepID=A0A267EEU6_9PLAT|nr:hypothetical protein BOX15_Mlig030816g2 [Macrostomum lignano]
MSTEDRPETKRRTERNGISMAASIQTDERASSRQPLLRHFSCELLGSDSRSATLPEAPDHKPAMLRPELFESVDLKNAVSQIMCLSRKSDLEYYETDPEEKAQVPDIAALDGLLMKRRGMFQPPPAPPPPMPLTQQSGPTRARRGCDSADGAKRGVGSSRYLLVNGCNALVSSFSHISMREDQQSKGKYVTLTFHVRQPGWFDQLKQVYVNAKSELDKLVAFIRRMRRAELNDASNSDEMDIQDFIKAERDLIYSEKNLRQWSYKFDIELRRDSLMRQAIDAFQCRLGLSGCDNLGYSFGLFLDECLYANEQAPRQVVRDGTPDNYKITDRADIFVTNYFAMAANRAFREEIVSVLYEVYVRDSAQKLGQQQQQQQPQQFLGKTHQPQLPLSSEFAPPSQANTLTHYEKQPLQQLQQQQPSAPIVRIQVPNTRRAAEVSGDESETDNLLSCRSETRESYGRGDASAIRQ